MTEQEEEQLTAKQQQAIQEQEFRYAALLQIRNNLKELTSQKSKKDFLTFVKLVAPTLVSDWEMGKHIEVISDKLQKVVEGKIKRLMVFLPPRSSKSVICSKLFPAWYIGKNPNHEILTVSHSDQLSSDFGRSVRDIVGTEEFTDMFPGVNLRQDVRAAGKWKTNLNGSYYAAGVRSQIAGRGAHVAILDDAMSEEDSFSDAGRRYIKEWWPSGLRTRIMPNGAIIIINTRYHYDDLCGWLLKQQDKFDIDTDIRWDVVSIPAWVDEDSSKLLGLPIGTIRSARTTHTTGCTRITTSTTTSCSSFWSTTTIIITTTRTSSTSTTASATTNSRCRSIRTATTITITSYS